MSLLGSFMACLENILVKLAMSEDLLVVICSRTGTYSFSGKSVLS